jgi:catechol 2,3-dioxygenase-like lactoylglutathione lyase family enzyme
MISTKIGHETPKESSGSAAIEMRFEVTTLPVADVDRAKAFYQRLGWRLDSDSISDEHTRSVQFTPPGSAASIQFGYGRTSMAPGPFHRLVLTVDDIEAVRHELDERGILVSPIWHTEPGHGGMPGPDPQHASYRSWAAFADPDGNTWLLQEITERLPGRV